MPIPIFQTPTRTSFALGDNQLHVWSINLDQPRHQVEAFEQLLSLDERNRAQRFYQVSDAQHFIIARGALRMLLADYLEMKPEHIGFAYGTHGKPALAASLNQPVCFNLSHSGSLALLAITSHGEVGVDIEALRTDFEVEAVGKQYFTRQAYAQICAAPASQQHQLFYRYWTLKEAYLKALGSGFS